MKKRQFSIGAVSDSGNVRENNQDNILALVGEDEEGEFGLFAIADGMGGLAEGHIASLIAVTSLKQWWHSEVPSLFMENVNGSAFLDRLDKLFRLINAQIIEYSAKASAKMGTTLSVLFLSKNYYYVGHIGDSRIYQLNPKTFLQATEDHSWVGEQVRGGNLSEKEAKVHPRRNLLTQCLGITLEICPYFSSGEYFEDLFLLCSDGFYNELPDDLLYEQMQAVQTGRVQPQGAINYLAKVIKSQTASDNLSAILVTVAKNDSF
jgi:serine/threonine protein phosphatase PrpC